MYGHSQVCGLKQENALQAKKLVEKHFVSRVCTYGHIHFIAFVHNYKRKHRFLYRASTCFLECISCMRVAGCMRLWKCLKQSSKIRTCSLWRQNNAVQAALEVPEVYLLSLVLKSPNASVPAIVKPTHHQKRVYRRCPSSHTETVWANRRHALKLKWHFFRNCSKWTVP